MAQSPEYRSARIRPGAKRRGLGAVLWVAALAVLGVVLFFPAALATDSSTFCRTCHEMVPYYDAWLVGQHAKDAQCIDCHVDAGLPARFSHKFVALGEVRSHFAGDTSFPRSSPPEIPNKRCTRCHTALPPTTPGGFSHEIHAQKGTCAKCHPATGHNVTAEALKSAGIFNASYTPTVSAGEFATLDSGAANIKGHKKVACSRCHDMAKTGCPRCHKPKTAEKHPWKGDCAPCHAAGDEFAFRHPGTADCIKCHTPPVDHYAGQCSDCHHSPGSSWKFAHPSAGEHSWKGKPCAACHPKGLPAVFCTCHGGKPPND